MRPTRRLRPRRAWRWIRRMSPDKTDAIREKRKRLKHAYDDLRREIRELRGAAAAVSRRREVLATA